MNTSIKSELAASPHASGWETKLSWLLQVLAAVIFAQTLYFKFRAAPESVYIFESLGVEPWGRIAAGVAELIAAVLLLVPRHNWIGAAMGLGVIGGAILSHLFVIGIVVQDDGGLLFALAVTVAISCSSVLYLRRSEAARFLDVLRKR